MLKNLMWSNPPKAEKDMEISIALEVLSSREGEHEHVMWNETKSWKGYRNFLSFGDSEHEYCLMWSDPPKAEKVYGNFHSSGDIEAWNSETFPHPLLYIPTLSLFAVSGCYSMNRESCALPGFIPHGVVILILISVSVFVEVSLWVEY